METLKRPYLLAAYYEWMIDNDYTPYVLVNADCEGVQVPEQYINEKRQILMNLSPMAIRDFKNDRKKGLISFRASFSGQPFLILLPILSICSISILETGEEYFFDDADEDPDTVEAYYSAIEEGAMQSVFSVQEKAKPFLQVVTDDDMNED